MSFIDPDLQDKWRAESEARRKDCFARTQGKHHHVGIAPCSYCGAASPDREKPRVTLVAGEYRAVFAPQPNVITIEKRGRDSIGAERWDAIHVFENKQSRSEPAPYLVPLFELLTKGEKP